MHQIFEQLVHMLLPVLPFTAQEAFQHRHRNMNDLSIHWAKIPEAPEEWHAPELAEKFQTQRDIRGVVNTALEKARAGGLFGSSLQASVILHDPKGHLTQSESNMAEMSIVSNFIRKDTPCTDTSALIDDRLSLGVVVAKAEGEKCERCWKVLPEVGTLLHETLCKRCQDAVTLDHEVSSAR
jgi:isoleucyl-tRNA synthetase